MEIVFEGQYPNLFDIWADMSLHLLVLKNSTKYGTTTSHSGFFNGPTHVYFQYFQQRLLQNKTGFELGVSELTASMRTT